MSVRFGGKLDSYQTLLLLEQRIGLGLFVWNLDTDELQWSDGMFALLGMKPGSVQPTPALTLAMTHPDDRMSPSWLRQEFREGHLLDREFRVVLPDGRVRHVSQRGWLIDVSGNNRQLAGVCVDVTPLSEARARSGLIQQRFKELANAAGWVVWIAQPDPHDLRTNSLVSAERLALEGRWIDRVHADDKQVLLTAWSRAVTSQQPFASLHRIAQADGSWRWYNSHATPLRGHEASVIEWIGASIDVHDLLANQQSSPITGAQIRGGRGILNWSVRDLADAAGLTIGIVRRLEEFDGTSRGYDGALSVILRAMETAGVEFLAPPGGKPAVRPR